MAAKTITTAYDEIKSTAETNGWIVEVHENVYLHTTGTFGRPGVAHNDLRVLSITWPDMGEPGSSRFVVVCKPNGSFHFATVVYDPWSTLMVKAEAIADERMSGYRHRRRTEAEAFAAAGVEPGVHYPTNGPEFHALAGRGVTYRMSEDGSEFWVTYSKDDDSLERVRNKYLAQALHSSFGKSRYSKSDLLNRLIHNPAWQAAQRAQGDRERAERRMADYQAKIEASERKLSAAALQRLANENSAIDLVSHHLRQIPGADMHLHNARVIVERLVESGALMALAGAIADEQALQHSLNADRLEMQAIADRLGQ